MIERGVAVLCVVTLLAAAVTLTAIAQAEPGPEQVDAEWKTRAIAGEAELERMTRLAHVRRQHLLRYRAVLRRHGNVAEAINLAATTYGVPPSTLWRKALCETGGTLWPRSFNRRSQASGLFQFLPSTWNSTPFWRQSVWSPYANALAAGWMHAHGRGDEWACR